MRITAPVSSRIDWMMLPPLPRSCPTWVWGTSTWTVTSPRESEVPSVMTRNTPTRASWAGVERPRVSLEEMVMRRSSVPGTRSWMLMAAPHSSRRREMVSPPLPMTPPTRETGTMTRYWIWAPEPPLPQRVPVRPMAPTPLRTRGRPLTRAMAPPEAASSCWATWSLGPANARGPPGRCWTGLATTSLATSMRATLQALGSPDMATSSSERRATMGRSSLSQTRRLQPVLARMSLM
mmetsp:Transcript_40462/g.128920  ORF Transcript_40462/g.128920 Transcript_40462/m.128920 type:complete len:236 (+) Transcript_40462:701-1408(+)